MNTIINNYYYFFVQSTLHKTETSIPQTNAEQEKQKWIKMSRDEENVQNREPNKLKRLHELKIQLDSETKPTECGELVCSMVCDRQP